MPKKIQECTRAHLISVPLPQHAASYTVITHQFVIDHSFQALANAGFVITEEEYRCTADGQIAQGIYKLQYNNDPDLSMMFAWTNSYNKQVKFKCLIGAYINQTGTVMTSGDIGTWTRKHVGTADVETTATIDDQVANAHMYYNQLVADKAIMTGISLNKRKQAQLLGILFAEYQILTTEQASIIRSQMDRPSHVYEDSNSLWAFYNYVTIALQHSHPRTWMEDQRILHYFISTVGNFNAPPQPVIAPVIAISAPVEEEVDPLYVIPNQTNLLDQIAEVEEIQIHIESDEEYAQRVAEIEGEPEELAAELHLAETTFMNARELELQNELEEDTFAMAQLSGVKAPEEIMDALMNAPEIDASDVDMSQVTWVAPDVAGNFTLKEVEPIVVQEGSDFDIDLHQSEEIILEVTEDKSAFVNDEIVTYTDVAGNTFIVPVVVEDFVSDEEEDMIMDQILIPIAAPTLEPTPEEHALFEAEEALYVVPLEEQQEADLDLKEAVAEVKEDNSSDFDLDFGSNDLEDDGVDNTPDFF
jgi:hypothetical protein